MAWQRGGALHSRTTTLSAATSPHADSVSTSAALPSSRKATKTSLLPDYSDSAASRQDRTEEDMVVEVSR